MVGKHEAIEEKNNLNKEKKIQYTARDAALLFAESLEQLFYKAEVDIVQKIGTGLSSLQSYLTQITALQQKISEQVQTRLADLDTGLKQAVTKQQQIEYSLQAIEKQLEAVIQQNRLLENAGKENLILSQDHYQQCIIEPMARSLFAVFDDIDGARRHYSEAAQINSQAVCDSLDGIYIHLRQFLSIYQVESIRHSPKSSFDPKVMKPLKTIATDNKDLNNCIAASLQVGFRWRDNKLLRPESVALYKYEIPQNNNLDKNERS